MAHIWSMKGTKYDQYTAIKEPMAGLGVASDVNPDVIITGIQGYFGYFDHNTDLGFERLYICS